MASQLNTQKLAETIKSKRGAKGLRTVAEEIGISASTLSRVEQGNLPDVDTFLILCRWLEISPEFFTISDTLSPNLNESIIVAHLRSDNNLPKETADALVRMVNLAYESTKASKNENLKKDQSS